MKGGAFARRFSDPVNATSVFTANFNGSIPEFSVQGVPRREISLEKTYHPRDAKLSDGVAGFVREWEGERRDNAGFHVPYVPKGDKFYTIGYGHNLGEDPPSLDTRWTERQALDQLKQDMLSAADRVQRLVKVPLTQSQFDALVSLAFNTTERSFTNSRMLRNLNEGNYLGAATEMLTFDHAGGVRLDGLTKRRRAEAESFLGSEAHRLPPLRPETR